MKTHLPKTLFVALMAAMASLNVQAEETEQPVSNKKYEVGTITTANGLPSNSGNYYKPTDENGNVITDLVLTGNDKMGTFNGDNLVQLGNLGKQEADKANGTVTKNVYVNSLTATGNSTVILGGQYVGNSKDEYTGIIAKDITVGGDASFTSYNATVDNLEVNGGTVNIHTSGNSKSGNGYYVTSAPEDSKQTQIKQSLTITDGIVNLGNAGGNSEDTLDHQQVAFGSLTSKTSGSIIKKTTYTAKAAQIQQKDGTLTVGGKSVSVGGLQIQQSGGDMSISKDNYHILYDYSDSKIEQTETATGSLTLGCIKSETTTLQKAVYTSTSLGLVTYNRVNLDGTTSKNDFNPSIEVIQKGTGSITMSGVDFSDVLGSNSTEKSSITQQGGGLINLNGDYEGATFDVTQKEQGGTIVLTGNMTADKVDQQSSTSTLEVNSGASLSANTVEAQGSIKNDGTLTANKLTVDNAPKTRAEGDAPAVENNGTMSITDVDVQSGTFVNNGTLNGTVTVNGGLFVNYGPAIMLLAEGDNTAQSTTQIIVNDGEARQFGTTKDSITVNGGTLTLGDNSSVADITLNSGSITLEGNATATALTLNGGVVNLGDNFTIDLNGGNVILGENVTFTVNVESLEDTTQSFTLFENIGNAADLDTGVNVVFKDANNGTQAGKIVITDGKVTATAVIPEPTTATLSLLALAGLAMRRRRK